MVTFTALLIRKKLAGGKQVTQRLLLQMAVPQKTVSFGISVVDNEQVLSAGTKISFSSLLACQHVDSSAEAVLPEGASWRKYSTIYFNVW